MCVRKRARVRTLVFIVVSVQRFSQGACYTINSYLVDPASSHMLVSKIKPCMSKYGSSTVKLRMAH